MFPFDLTPDRCNGWHNHGPKLTGTATVIAKFDTDLTNVTMMAIVSFDGHFMMDNCLTVWVDRG